MKDPTEFKKAMKINELFKNALEGTQLGSGVRIRTASGLLYVSMQHFDSINILISKSLHGSAVALVRPQYEAMIRGFWYFECANDTEIERFLAGGEAPKIKKMITDLEKLPSHSRGSLSRVHDRIWDTLNDFTHGGSGQVHSHNSEIDIGVNFKPEALSQIMKTSSSIALMAACEVSKIVGDAEMAKLFVDRFNIEFTDSGQ